MEILNLPPEKFFYLNDGRILKSLHELPDALRTMSEDTFRHHVTPERNDFYNWAANVFQHARLARKIKAAKTRDAMAKKVFMELYL